MRSNASQFARRFGQTPVQHHFTPPRERRSQNLNPRTRTRLKASSPHPQPVLKPPCNRGALKAADSPQQSRQRFGCPVSLMYCSSLISTETDLRTPSIHLSKRSFWTARYTSLLIVV